MGRTLRGAGTRPRRCVRKQEAGVREYVKIAKSDSGRGAITACRSARRVSEPTRAIGTRRSLRLLLRPTRPGQKMRHRKGSSRSSRRKTLAKGACPVAVNQEGDSAPLAEGADRRNVMAIGSASSARRPRTSHIVLSLVCMGTSSGARRAIVPVVLRVRFLGGGSSGVAARSSSPWVSGELHRTRARRRGRRHSPELSSTSASARSPRYVDARPPLQVLPPHREAHASPRPCASCHAFQLPSERRLETRLRRSRGQLMAYRLIVRLAARSFASSGAQIILGTPQAREQRFLGLPRDELLLAIFAASTSTSRARLCGGRFGFSCDRRLRERARGPRAPHRASGPAVSKLSGPRARENREASLDHGARHAVTRRDGERARASGHAQGEAETWSVIVFEVEADAAVLGKRASASASAFSPSWQCVVATTAPPRAQREVDGDPCRQAPPPREGRCRRRARRAIRAHLSASRRGSTRGSSRGR